MACTPKGTRERRVHTCEAIRLWYSHPNVEHRHRPSQFGMYPTRLWRRIVGALPEPIWHVPRPKMACAPP
eukprot:7383124-Prymnesium_polylepis.1